MPEIGQQLICDWGVGDVGSRLDCGHSARNGAKAYGTIGGKLGPAHSPSARRQPSRMDRRWSRKRLRANSRVSYYR